MIYFATTEHERYHIDAFLSDKKNLATYLILVIVATDEQMLIGKQITRSKLDNANWLLATFDEFKALIEKHGEPFTNLFVMELTMTDKGEVFFFAHNWGLLAIDHEPKTEPFDGVFAKVINSMVDQVIYNFDNESVSYRKRAAQLLHDLILSGMFQMVADPKKMIGG